MQNAENRRRGGIVAVAVGVALISAWGLSQSVNAALLINLQFTNGGTSMALSTANAGQDIPVLVYGTVMGSKPVTTTPGATTGDFDGMNFVYYDILSSTGSNGGVAGGIDSGATNSSYVPQLNGTPTIGSQPATGFDANGSQPGAVQDLNGDGIADLGSSSDLTEVAKPRYNIDVFDNAPSSSFGSTASADPTGAPDIVIGGTNNNSVSFLLETIYFQVGPSLAAGQITSLNPVPYAVQSPYTQSNYFVDTPTTSQGSLAPYTDTVASAGTSVQFTDVPEPASLAWASLAAIAVPLRRMLGHRRQRS